MTPRSGRSPAQRRRRKKLVLVFGEDANDTALLTELIIALCPEFDGHVKPFRKPPILIKDAEDRKLPDRVSAITKLIDAEAAVADVICIFAHEACDAVEPAHEALSHKIREAFAAGGYDVIPVTPAWETESWLFLWPEALASYRPKWRRLDGYRGRDVGRIVDAKETLTRALRPKGGRDHVRDYRESDAPAIGEIVRRTGAASSPEAKSDSYEDFRRSVEAVCVS